MRPNRNVVFHLHRGAIYVCFKIETKGFPYNMDFFHFLDVTKHNDDNDDDDGDDHDNINTITTTTSTTTTTTTTTSNNNSTL